VYGFGLPASGFEVNGGVAKTVREMALQSGRRDLTEVPAAAKAGRNFSPFKTRCGKRVFRKPAKGNS
jgi:hypothetical protein